MAKKHLIIFVKNPVLGNVKTRLAATIGDEKALEIYQLLLRYTRDLTQRFPVSKTVYYSDFIDVNDIWSNSVYKKSLQKGEDLGQRMKNAFIDSFESGFERVCIIGCDCYQLTATVLNNAFDNLATSDVTIGPSTDGGYYLLGMNRLHSALFEGIAWSTPEVLEQTLHILDDYHLQVSFLPLLTDVDEEKDLKTMRRF
jgi:uncharacterized protein